MASMNRVFLIGNLGADPELRHTANGTAVTTLSVATTDYKSGPDGERQEHTEWHRVVVWSKQAELCAQYLTKGRPVMVEGRLATRSWEDAQGEKRYTTEVVANTVQFLGGRDLHAVEGEGQGQSDETRRGKEPGPRPSARGARGGGSVAHDLRRGGREEHEELPF